MRISAITRQQKRSDRSSVFIDGKYAFSLSDSALIESKLAPGQEIDGRTLKQLVKLAGEDKLYGLTLRWLSLRQRSEWEVQFYLKRKHNAPEELYADILNKLRKLDLIDDRRFAESFVRDRVLLGSTSKRKLIMELRSKHIPSEIIEEVVGNELDPSNELKALNKLIERRRKPNATYKDDLRLMRYLSRQGFNYEDIKSAINYSGNKDNRSSQ